MQNKKKEETTLLYAADAHARAVLGDDQYKNNKDAVKSIMNDFAAGADWANRHGEKARKWDMLQEAICKFYEHDNEDNPEDGFASIGEVAAKHFGFL